MNIARGCLIVLALILTGLCPAFGDPQSEELAALQGTWKGTETGHEAKGTCTITVEGSAVRFQGWHKDEWYKGTFKLILGQKPKQLHAKVTDCPVPEFVGKTSHAIYRIQDGTLTLVARRPGDPGTPSGFEDSKSRKFVLKNTEPKESGPANALGRLTYCPRPTSCERLPAAG
jgi:uncharacterized protein (TIGR03067 family)